MALHGRRCCGSSLPWLLAVGALCAAAAERGAVSSGSELFDRFLATRRNSSQAASFFSGLEELLVANSGSPSSDDVDDNTLLQRNIQRLIQAFASRTSKQSSDSDKGGASKSKAGGIDDAPPHQAAPWLGSGGGGGVLASAFRTALSKLRPAATSSVNDSGGDSQQSNATVSLNGTAGVVIPPAAVAGGLLQLAQTPGKPLFAGAGDRGSVAAAEGSIPGGGRLLKFFSLKQQLAGLSVRLTELESALRDAYYARARWEAQRVVDKAYGLRRGLDITALRDAVRQAFDYQCEPSEFVPPAPQNATILGPSATYVLAAGSCNLARVTTPLAAEYIVTCVAPSATLTVTQPRYIAEHVTAATFRTSACVSERRFGLDSVITIDLFNPGAGASVSGERGDVKWGEGGALGDADGDGRPNFKDPEVISRLKDALSRVAAELSLEARDVQTSFERKLARFEELAVGLLEDIGLGQQAVALKEQFRAWKVDVKGRFPLLFIERKRGAVKEIFQAVLQEGLAATLTRKARAKEELYREAAADTTTTTAADGGGTVTEIRVDSGRPPQRVRTVRRGRRGGPGTTDASDEQPPQPQYEYEEPLYYDYDYSYEPTGDSGTRSDGDATETAADTASAGSASDSLGQRQQRRRPRRKKPQQQAQQQRSAIEVLADEMHKLLRKAGADLPEEPIVAASRRMQQASQIAGQP